VKLIMQVAAGILLAVVVVVGLLVVPTMLTRQQAEAFITDIEIDCSKSYTVARVEAERLRRCQ
jgi:hypothetical protein